MPAQTNRDVILSLGVVDAAALVSMAEAVPALRAVLDAAAPVDTAEPEYRVRAVLVPAEGPGAPEHLDLSGTVAGLQAALLERLEGSPEEARRLRVPHIYDAATGEHLTAAAPVWWTMYELTRAHDARLAARAAAEAA